MTRLHWDPVNTPDPFHDAFAGHGGLDPVPGNNDASRADAVALPRSAVLMLWSAAYLRGDIGPDDASAHSLGTGHRHTEGGGEDLFDWMTALRRLGGVHVRLVLPLPGRIAGLIGPPAAVTSALSQQQAIVVTAPEGGDHTLVPTVQGIGPEGTSAQVVTWTAFPAPAGAHPAAPPTGGARETFLRALGDAAAGTTHLDLVPEEPLAPGLLPGGWTTTLLPRHIGPETEHLLQLTGRCLLLAGHELEAGSAQVHGASEAQVRDELLRSLRDGAREALMEAVDEVIGRELR